MKLSVMLHESVCGNHQDRQHFPECHRKIAVKLPTCSYSYEAFNSKPSIRFTVPDLVLKCSEEQEWKEGLCRELVIVKTVGHS